MSPILKGPRWCGCVLELKLREVIFTEGLIQTVEALPKP